MAKEEATLLIRIKQVGKSAISGIQSALGTLGGAIKLGAAAFGALGAAATAAAQKFGAFRGVERSFTKLAQSQGQQAKAMLDNMRQLSRGTVSDLKLMQSANQALLLGLPVDRFGEMVKIAQSASAATGQSMDFMLNSIVTGLGRGSKLILDNLGIVFKAEDANKAYAQAMNIVGRELTEAEKKQAFINMAMEVGAKNAAKLGQQNLTVNQSMDKLKASMENGAVAIGEAAAPAVQFLTEAIGDFFTSADTAANQSTLQEFFLNTAKVVTVMWKIFEAVGQGIGVIIASVSNSLANLFRGNFSAAASSMKDGLDGLKEIAVNHAEETGQALDEIDARYAQQRVERAQEEAQMKAEVRAQAREQEREINQEAWDEEQALRFEQSQAELDLIGATEAEKLAYIQRSLDMQLKTAKTMQQKKAIWEAKEQTLERQRKLKQQEWEKQRQEEQVRNLQGTLSTISTLQNSNNKTLVAIGKAAAIAQIAIQAPVGISRAMASAPPPFSFVLAGLVAAAFAAQAAAVAGVQLADGGIIPATPGGITATVGEGGRSEAVIPLPDDFDPDEGGLAGGGGMTIVFNGPLLGDQEQAREFATFIDQQLFQLRQNNQSVAFDEDIV